MKRDIKFYFKFTMNSIPKILSFFILLSVLLPTNSIFAANTDIPTILPRSEWTKSDPSLEKLLTWMPDKNKTNPPDYYPVERIIIHYTETPNTDNTKEVSISRIQAIYQYHSVTRGWGDIGYNYIIDRLGNIYEGRYGGNSVRAAHAFNSITRDNYNVGAIGISLLGNYEKEEPPEAMFTSLKKLVGWLSATNGFEPNTGSSSKIWNEKQGGFTTEVNLPRVISHKDIDSTNDSGIPASKFNELRSASQTYYNEYKNYLYQVSSQGPVYEILNGEKIIANNIEGKIIAAVSQTQLNIFSTLSVLKHPDGTLIKTNNSGVSLIQAGLKRPIVNQEIFNSRFKWNQVIAVAKSEWDSYFEGSPVALKDGIIARANGENEIYIIANSLKQWISGPELFEKLGYKWSNVAVVSKSTLDVHSLATPITDTAIHPDGTLITSAGQGVALLSQGNKRPIPTAEIFQFQYQWKDIVAIPIAEWNNYPEADTVYYPDGMLFREVGDHKVFVVENSQKRWITSPVLFDNLGYQWNNVVVVSNGMSDGMALGDNISAENVVVAKR